MELTEKQFIALYYDHYKVDIKNHCKCRYKKYAKKLSEKINEEITIL